MTAVGLYLVLLIAFIVGMVAVRNVFGAWAVMGGVLSILLARECWLAGSER